MGRLTREDIEHLSEEWYKIQVCPKDERAAFRDRLTAIPCSVAFPLGELMNPELIGYMWILLYCKGMPKPGPLTSRYNFDTHGLEGCIEVADEDLAHALLLWRKATTPYRMNIFVKGELKVNDFKANVISVTKVRLALQKLLAGYESEKAENERDNDAHGIEYWEGACQTIEEVATELKIALGVEDDGE